jgi:hypothetical protein
VRINIEFDLAGRGGAGAVMIYHHVLESSEKLCRWMGRGQKKNLLRYPPTCKNIPVGPRCLRFL